MILTLPWSLVPTLGLACVLLIPAAAHAWRQVISEGDAFAVTADLAGNAVAAGRTRLPPSSNRDFTVVKVDANGMLAWRVDYDGGLPGATDEARDIAVDAAGDVIAVGHLVHAGTGSDFAAVKLDGATGGELWRTEITGAGFEERATALAIDASGDVLAVGHIDETPTVLRLAGATGAELWRSPVTGQPSQIVIDAAGDLLVAGEDVHKLDGATGAVLWAYASPTFRAFDLAPDGSGDALVAGTSITNDAAAVKLAGATGAELWRFDAAGAGGPSLLRAVAVDGAGNAVLGGDINHVGTESDFTVLKLAAGTGAELWRREIRGSGRSEDLVIDLALDAAGDVLAAGAIGRGRTAVDLAVVKLAGLDGAETWRQLVDGGGGSRFEWANSVAVHPTGDAVAAGALVSEDADSLFAIFGLDAVSGAVGPAGGRVLSVRDRAGAPEARAITARAKDGTLVTPPAGGAGDPTTSGGTLQLVNPTTLETATIPLPAAGWVGLGNPPGARGYRYSDPQGTLGPCSRVKIGAGSLTARCSGRLGPIPFSLDEPSQGTLALSLELGAAAPQCLVFGGGIVRDAGTADPGPDGSFFARNAPPAQAGCP
jgi:hypothetical protein